MSEHFRVYGEFFGVVWGFFFGFLGFGGGLGLFGIHKIPRNLLRIPENSPKPRRGL